VKWLNHKKNSKKIQKKTLDFLNYKLFVFLLKIIYPQKKWSSKPKKGEQIISKKEEILDKSFLINSIFVLLQVNKYLNNHFIILNYYQKIKSLGIKYQNKKYRLLFFLNSEKLHPIKRLQIMILFFLKIIQENQE
jgi:hypothetical protein